MAAPPAELPPRKERAWRAQALQGRPSAAPTWRQGRLVSRELCSSSQCPSPASTADLGFQRKSCAEVGGIQETLLLKWGQGWKSRDQRGLRLSWPALPSPGWAFVCRKCLLFNTESEGGFYLSFSDYLVIL